MRHVECAWPRCSKCDTFLVVRLGLSMTSGEWQPVWQRDCKCRYWEPVLALDDDREPLMIPLDNLAPRTRKRAAS